VEQAAKNTDLAPDTPVLHALKPLSGTCENSLQSYGPRTILHFRSLANAGKTHGNGSPQYHKEITLLRVAIDALNRLTDEDLLTLTIVMMPKESDSAERSINSYGFEGLQRRSASAQGRVSEAIISASNPSGAASTSQQSARPQQAAQRPNTLARTPIPSKFYSRIACEKTTNNCTGHGMCISLYNETDANRKQEYFGCACTKPEVRTNKDGSKKTTWFGGAACQKKSVVAPFWLLAGVTVLLVSIVSMGIGLLFSMGSEELPSVIGAGVSGPRPK